MFPLVLFVVGMWLALGAMRRRVGIPMLAGEPSRSASDEMLISGLGLGGLVYAMTHLDALAALGIMPRPPTTTESRIPIARGDPRHPYDYADDCRPYGHRVSRGGRAHFAVDPAGRFMGLRYSDSWVY